MRANDDFFRPNVDPVGSDITTELHSYEDNRSESKFTDIPLDGKLGYFVIAAPSTWPPFNAKMRYLLDVLAKLKENYKIILVYLAEAHADDVWPLGFGVK